jgi:ketosteroid isomerase-like protein
MASSAVDLVTLFTGALGSGDVDTCLALVHDELVFSEAECLPFGGDFVGRQGLLELLSAVGRDYRIQLEAPQVDRAGDRVLVRVRGTIASRATGREMPLEALDLYDVRDGLIARVDVFYKDAAAVTALCHSEPTTRSGEA